MTITVHPGGFIKRNYIDELDLSAAELARALEVSESTLSRLLNEKIDLSPEMAVKVSKVLGRSAESWMNMQGRHTLARYQTEMSRWKPAARVSTAGKWVHSTAQKKTGAKKDPSKSAVA